MTLLTNVLRLRTLKSFAELIKRIHLINDERKVIGAFRAVKEELFMPKMDFLSLLKIYGLKSSGKPKRV